MRNTRRAGRREGGQILVLFALGLIAMLAMVGLVLDGGGAFAYRRDGQNAVDLAAVAGANAYMNTAGTSALRTAAATAAARDAASRNGYVHGSASASLDVTVGLLSTGARVTVNLTSPYRTTFARVVGQDQWNVSVTAAAVAGAIDTAVGAGPWIMHMDAFNADGSPKYTAANPKDFGTVNGDYPVDGDDIAWTDFNGSNNVNSNEVRKIIDGTNVVTETIGFDQYIGQHNSGHHTTLYAEVRAHLVGKSVPVPVVGDCPNDDPSEGGCFKGWVMFHVLDAKGASGKDITGYFLGNVTTQPLTLGECTTDPGDCGDIPTSTVFGQYIVRLEN